MIIESAFYPAWWLPGPHLQTLWPHLFRRTRIALRRERLELPDGDFVDLAWNNQECADQERIDPDRDTPLVSLFHGLGGCSRSHYAAGLLRTLRAAGYPAVLMHFRGCGGRPNRLARGYHAGDTGDIRYLIETLGRRFPGRPLAAVGFSLGGNALLKWLGESGRGNPLHCAVAVSAPFDLAATADRLDRHGARLYGNYLLRRMREAARNKLDHPDYPVDAPTLARLDTFRTFDDRITAPLHGFGGVDEYYASASARRYLKTIARPTLILHARDDPFLPAQGIPKAAELSDAVTLELAAQGGHVGFIEGRIPGRPHYWLDGRIIAWLSRRCTPVSTEC